MNKIFTILIIGFLLTSCIVSSTSINIKSLTDEKNIQNNTISIKFDDILDQFQIISTNFTVLGRLPESLNLSYNFTYAQSFIPQSKILTRIELNLTRNQTTIYDIFLAVRENLTGEDLASIHLSADNVLEGNFSWIEFDFDDIYVDIGKTYYIVSYTSNFTENFYGWTANNNSESYPFGCAWVSIDDGNTWSNSSCAFDSSYGFYGNNNQGLILVNDSNYTWDMCFKTYGADNLPPESLDIDGPIEGVIGEEYSYEIFSVDPDGDDVYYYIDWGDDTSDEWIGPYDSEEIVNINHIWSAVGNYTIAMKAKDTQGEESGWVYLKVTMPLNQPKQYYDFPIIKKIIELLEKNHPLIKMILQLY